jgi:hypothetical protein
MVELDIELKMVSPSSITINTQLQVVVESIISAMTSFKIEALPMILKFNTGVNLDWVELQHQVDILTSRPMTL